MRAGQLLIQASGSEMAPLLLLRASLARSGIPNRPPGQSTRLWGESYATSMTTAPSFLRMSASGYVGCL